MQLCDQRLVQRLGRKLGLKLLQIPEVHRIEEVEQVEEFAQVVVERRACEENAVNGLEGTEPLEDQVRGPFH